MKKLDLSKSRDKFKEIANNVNDKTKDAALNFGNATKKAVANMSENIKDSSEQLSKQIDKAIQENDLKRLCPFFKEQLYADTFTMPPMIRIVDYDKRKENSVCEGAIGFETNTKEMKVLNIYSEYANLLNLDFYPHKKDSVFYIDPCHKNLYISLDEYFAYLKKVRVDELQTIAQDLGAKHVKISLKEQKKSVTSRNVKLNAHIKMASVTKSRDTSNNDISNLEVAAEADFVGRSTPIKPTLDYFRNESDINALVKMRMNPENQNTILSKTYSFQYSNSSGIKVNEAVKIDEALTKMNCGVGCSVLNEALSESRTILEYSIEF